MNLKKEAIIAMLMLLTISNAMLVYANTDDKPPSYEEMYTQFGYISVDEAVQGFEKHFKENVNLPLRLPPISFTHQFGRFYEDKHFNTNDFLEIEYINDKIPAHTFYIMVRPLNNKINLKDRGDLKSYSLANGHRAIYKKDRLFHFLFFETDHWQYTFGLDKRVSNEVTPEELIKIANSIHYVSEKKDRIHCRFGLFLCSVPYQIRVYVLSSSGFLIILYE